MTKRSTWILGGRKQYNWYESVSTAWALKVGVNTSSMLNNSSSSHPRLRDICMLRTDKRQFVCDALGSSKLVRPREGRDTWRFFPTTSYAELRRQIKPCQTWKQMEICEMSRLKFKRNWSTIGLPRCMLGLLKFIQTWGVRFLTTKNRTNSWGRYSLV